MAYYLHHLDGRFYLQNSGKSFASTSDVSQLISFMQAANIELLYFKCALDTAYTVTIVDALSTLPMLKIVRFGATRMSHDAAAALGAVLRVTTTIKVVSLNMVGLDDTAAVAIADGLRANNTVVDMELMHNDIGVTGATALADALRTNTTVRRLNVGYNHLSVGGAKAFADALRINTTLRTLHINNNNIGSLGRDALYLAIRENSMLRGVLTGYALPTVPSISEDNKSVRRVPKRVREETYAEVGKVCEKRAKA
jgi:hypothetical protein